MFERPPAAGDAEFPGVLVLLPSEVIRRIRQADGLPRRPARVPIGATDCAVGTSLASVGGPLGRIDWEQREMAPGMRAEWAETSRNDRDSYVGRHGPRLAEKALSRGTRSVYGRAVASFDDWRGARPATDASLADYLGVLFDRGMAPATASVVVAAVVEAAGDGSPPRGELTDRALAGFRRDGAGRGSGQVDGLSWEQVDRMAALAERSANRAAGLRDALLLRVGSDCLLRVAEAAALDVADIAFEEDWLRVVVRRSKTDQEGKGAVLYAGAPTARLARMWLATAGIEEGPLFRAVNKTGRVSGTRLSARSMRDIVRRRAETAGIEGRISGHSLRVGAAQSLRDAGATLPELLTAGRWKRVETMARYTSAQEASAGPVARLRYGVEAPGGRKPSRSWRGGPRRSSGTSRRSPEASGESRRMRKAARPARKAAKRVEKTLARVEESVLGSGKADLWNPVQPFVSHILFSFLARTQQHASHRKAQAHVLADACCQACRRLGSPQVERSGNSYVISGHRAPGASRSAGPAEQKQLPPLSVRSPRSSADDLQRATVKSPRRRAPGRGKRREKPLGPPHRTLAPSIVHWGGTTA